MKTKKRKYKISAVLFWAVLLLIPVSQGFSQEKAFLATTEITLKGNAIGGILTLVEIPQRNCRYVSISTQPGESSESVAMRLADIINNSNPFKWGGTFEVIVKDSSLTLLGAPGTYAFTGTETGLGIPEPPTSLSGKYDANKNSIILNWINPEFGFDEIFIAKYGFPSPTYRKIDGSNENYFDQNEEYLQLLDVRINFDYFFVIGARNGVPSGPGAIYLDENSQQELFGIPFTNGIAPNWTTWVMGNEKNAMRFEQGVREEFVSKGRVSNSITHPATKPFFQVIKTASSTTMAGVKRKFIGLTPGHTYRISARLSTLEMDSVEEDWSYSLHAAYNAPSKADLSVEQLSGTAALHDGSRGAAAGRIAIYDPELTTNGTWEKRSTGKEWRGFTAPDITLPAGVDTITVWVRCRGNASTAFGIDWVKLEDITMINKDN